VRIAPYFPGDVDEVERIIGSTVLIEKVKVFPRDSDPAPYLKRFSGYAACHFRVKLQPVVPADSQKARAAEPGSVRQFHVSSGYSELLLLVIFPKHIFQWQNT